MRPRFDAGNLYAIRTFDVEAQADVLYQDMRHAQGLAVRKFRRTVRAGGAEQTVYVVVIRTRPEGQA